MSEQVHVVEDHRFWRLLSNGEVIYREHPMWGKHPGSPPEPPAGPRVVLRSEFDAMTHPQRHELARDITDGKVRLVDSIEQKQPAPPPRQLPTITRASFDAMTHDQKTEIAKDCYEGRARLID